MSTLARIQMRIQDTSAMLTKLDRALAQQPKSKSVLADIRSLQRRMGVLEEEFMYAAERDSRDVYTYRLFGQAAHNLPLRGFTSALEDFQSLLSLAYDVVKHGPKARGRVHVESAASTALDFGYAFAGSVGVVLTSKNERLLIDTEFDEATRLVFDMVRCESTEDVSAYAKEYGAAIVRSLYEWSNAHVQHDLGADIEWKSLKAVKDRVTVEPPHLQKLKDAISAASDTKTTTVTLGGVLVGADVVRGTFRFAPDSGGSIAGSAKGVIDNKNQVIVPSRVRLRLRKMTVTHYAIEKEDVTWQLLEVDPKES